MKKLNAQRAVDLLQSKTCGIYKTSLLKEIIEGKILVEELEHLVSLFDSDQPKNMVAEVTEKPEGIDVQIIDHDNLEDVE